MNIGHNTSFNSVNFSTINAQLFLFCSITTLPTSNLDLIVLRTFKSSIVPFEVTKLLHVIVIKKFFLLKIIIFIFHLIFPLGYKFFLIPLELNVL